MPTLLHFHAREERPYRTMDTHDDFQGTVPRYDLVLRRMRLRLNREPQRVNVHEVDSTLALLQTSSIFPILPTPTVTVST